MAVTVARLHVRVSSVVSAKKGLICTADRGLKGGRAGRWAGEAKVPSCSSGSRWRPVTHREASADTPLSPCPHHHHHHYYQHTAPRTTILTFPHTPHHLTTTTLSPLRLSPPAHCHRLTKINPPRARRPPAASRDGGEGWAGRNSESRSDGGSGGLAAGPH
ncbi:hypothetical protein E2C01_017541 [Portunus trituberculatus]|uniref:Uncharacterized protein n=1 Tax=Portunus trituberculatus TaxID=210409 RepID=A0A5B7DS69_PORTR|nr:hypothetical protein [Portunus trituberculatus]